MNESRTEQLVTSALLHCLTLKSDPGGRYLPPYKKTGSNVPPVAEIEHTHRLPDQSLMRNNTAADMRNKIYTPALSFYVVGSWARGSPRPGVQLNR